MSEDGEKDPPFANSVEAYRAIHRALSHWVEGSLEGGDEDGALKYAAMMRAVEKILKGDAVEMLAND